ncbi:MAG: SpoIIIAH-like family protein [Oscillospiraceae bacterium]|jgi:stage III sporulation protein AH|nr:SpoIIIAH-like family protein [Oscillospiraceae bacterium]
MKIHKRQVVLGALVLALGTAVYLNWQFSPSKEKLVSSNEDVKTTSSDLGEAMYVNTNTIEKSVSQNIDLFSKLKQERETFRNSLKQEIEDSLSKQTNPKVVKILSSRLNRVFETLKLEDNVETIAKVKGINCLATISDQECVLAVGEKLDKSKVLVLTDIVKGQTGYECEKIKIIEKQ